MILFGLSETDFHYNLQQVAMTREKFPEKIPFRLTRMLTNAMEVGNSAESYPVINTKKCMYYYVYANLKQLEGCFVRAWRVKNAIAEKSF